VYVPGASGSIIQLDSGSGAVVRESLLFKPTRIPFETGPVSADRQGNLYYNAIKLANAQGFLSERCHRFVLVKVSRMDRFRWRVTNR